MLSTKIMSLGTYWVVGREFFWKILDLPPPNHHLEVNRKIEGILIIQDHTRTSEYTKEAAE